MSNIYTDLALEAAEALCRDSSSVINGVEVDTEQEGDTIITWVKITNDNGSRQLGKPVGNYITIESAAMKDSDVNAHESIIRILSDKLAKLSSFNADASILVVGLGNASVTPDALGPKVVSKTLVTRHIMDTVPKGTSGTVRPVSAITPGVMGTTGIETCDIIKGICDEIKPSLVIAIDALAARRTSRINATIQISDTGVSPGAGMGNNRKVVNEQFLGVPVLAIGVPTVVDAATLVNDTMDLLLSSMITETDEGSAFYEMLSNLESQEKYSLLRQVLDPFAGNMFVTPKEVDSVIDRLSNIIANAINIALHPGISTDDINRFMY